MDDRLNQGHINHVALVGYALARALFDHLDGGQMRGEVAGNALQYLPAQPDKLEAPVEHKMWLDAEAELKRLAGRG